MSKRLFRLTAKFCGDDAEARAERVVAHLDVDASAASCAKALTACGWQTRTLSAELRVAMLESCAVEWEHSNSAFGDEKAKEFLGMARAVREPTGWDDVAPFSGRRAGEA